MTTTIPTERAALILQMDAGYTPTTTDPARACASCRWYSELPGTSQCHLVVNSPEPINAGGGCNRHEPIPEGSVVISYMEDYGVENPNNGNIPARVLADSIMYSGEALENLNGYLAETEQLSASRSALPALEGQPVAYRFVDRAARLAPDVLGVVTGYVYIHGDPDHRDAYGTFFDPTRPVALDIENGAFRRPIKYEHCSDPIIGMDTVGYIDTVALDDTGLRFEGSLDRSSPHFERIVRELQSGELFTSSATGEHTAKFREDGSFEAWTLLELSLTKYPAESRIPQVSLIRSASHEEVRVEPRAGDEPHVEIEIELPSEAPELEGEKTMTPEQLAMLQQLVAEFGIDAVEAALEQANAPVPAEAAPVAEVAMSAAPAAVPAPGRSLSIDALRSALVANKQNSALEARLAALESARNAAPAQQPIVRGAQRPGEGVNVNLIEAQRFARFSHDEMFLAAQILTENHVPTSEAFRRSLAHRGLDYAQKSNNPDNAVAAIRSTYTRADDFMASDIAGKGTEWVGTFYGSDVWNKARTAPIMDMLIRKGIMQVEVPDGASNAVIPLEGSDPTVYTTAQSNDADATGSPEIVVGLSYAGTSSATVTPGELTTAVPYTDILSEDSVLMGGLVAQLNFQINEVMIRQPEYVFINGDTTATASTNINLIDGTPGTGINKPAYMVSDGALKLALVTNSAMSRDGGTLDDEDFRITTTLFDGDIQSDPDRTAFVLDPFTYSKSLAMLALKTRDVAGVDATLFTGKLPPLLGIDVFRSGQMAKANSAGKIPVAGGTLGRILAVYAPYWALVWKRRMTIENARVALAKSNVIIASMRLGFRYRATNAAAVSYNLTL